MIVVDPQFLESWHQIHHGIYKLRRRVGRELLRCSGMPPGASSSNKRFHLNFSARRPDLAALDDGIEIWGSRCQQKAMEGWKLTGPYLSRVRLVSRPTAHWLPLLRSAGYAGSH